MDDQEALHEIVELRREKHRLEKQARKNKRKKRASQLLTVFLIALTVVFLLRVSPLNIDMMVEGSEKEAVIPHEEYEVFEEHYTSELENGFCLYGEVTDDEVIVREVAYVEDPVAQDKYSIEFTCLPETRERLAELVFRSDYQWIGSAHTHPNTPDLSRKDAAVLGATWYVSDVMGIYNGDELNFYAFDNPSEPMMKTCVDESLEREVCG